MYDAVVIGGGFYGAGIARYLVQKRGFSRIVLVEQEQELLARASYCNQARVHNGYHYPRSFTTAYRSRVNCPRFARDFPSSVTRNFTSIYAIARQHSKVTARQFERFCAEIGASLKRAPAEIARLMEPRLVEAVYIAEEFSFDALRLREWALEQLRLCGVELRLATRATAVGVAENGEWPRIETVGADGITDQVTCRYLFNCTYSGVNHLGGDIVRVATTLKQEITEMALLEVPPELSELGITVMDGPYFSVTPFPPRGLHILSHVRYTPHCFWIDQTADDPYGHLDRYAKTPRADRMIRDTARYLPAISKARYVESLFEVKTVLVKNEADDGRPILFERNVNLPRCYSVVGSKMDNIYDVLQRLDSESLPLH